MGFDNENAMNALTSQSWMAFDIETCPMPSCAEFLVEPIEAPANYKDPIKIAAYIEEKRKAQILDAGLDLDLCEIVAVAGAFEDRGWAQTREYNSEADMIRHLWRFVAGIQREHGTLVGFNVLHFDLPILLRRSLYLGIEAPKLSIDKYRHDGIADVADILTYGGRTKWRSLAFYCKRFGIPFDDSVDGSQIAQLVAEKNWRAIEAHCVADVTATAALARRIGVVYAPIQQELEAVI